MSGATIPNTKHSVVCIYRPLRSAAKARDDTTWYSRTSVRRAGLSRRNARSDGGSAAKAASVGAENGGGGTRGASGRVEKARRPRATRLTEEGEGAGAGVGERLEQVRREDGSQGVQILCCGDVEDGQGPGLNGRGRIGALDDAHGGNGHENQRQRGPGEARLEGSHGSLLLLLPPCCCCSWLLVGTDRPKLLSPKAQFTNSFTSFDLRIPTSEYII